MKKIVIPGELLSEERKRLGGNVFVSDGKIYSRVLGISDDENERATVIPLEGKYNPQIEDTIIGVVSRVIHAGYIVDVNSYAESFIPRSALRNGELKVGDVIMAKVTDVNEVKEANISFPKRMFDGDIIPVTAVRTPRLIGKNGSMLELLRNGTGADVIVGKNGRIWAKGGDLELLRKVVFFIENNSYKSNLTKAVEGFFK